MLGRTRIDTGLVASEFRLPELEALQDEFRRALKKERINRTFPHARFFQASFETRKVRALYDTFLAFPEPDTLAALIQLSRSPEGQERGDALMALVFLHLQAPELSVSKDRWWSLYQAAIGQEHYTALVFRARLNAYGEYGAKNLRQALSDLVTAGGLKETYTRGDGTRKEFDTQNYELVHGATAKDLFLNEPNMPFRQQWQGPAQMAQQIEQAQQAFKMQLPNTRVGRMYAEAARINAESIEIGNQIIRRTQGGNQLAGQIEGLKSLRANAAGEKPVFEDISPEIQSAQLKIIAQVGSLDEEQRALLAQAQEKRLIAQGIIYRSYADVVQMSLAHMGDFVKMAAPLPALTEANNALIQSCIILSKWEQAMRAKDVPKVDAKKAESAVVDLQARYKD